jgi:hypothetical protein
MNKPSARSTATAIGFIAAGAIAATALTGLAFASGNASPPSGSTPATGAPGTPGPDTLGMHRGHGRWGGPHGSGMRMMRPDGPVLHGELVVKDKSGAVKTVRVQTGTITGIAGSTITVTSSDNVAWTWTLDSSTRIRRDMKKASASDLAVNDGVALRGEENGATTTAKAVNALSPAGLAKEKKLRTQMQKMWKQGRPSGAPSGPPMPGMGMMQGANDQGATDPASLGL